MSQLYDNLAVRGVNPLQDTQLWRVLYGYLLRRRGFPQSKFMFYQSQMLKSYLPIEKGAQLGEESLKF
jgi:hypothetical protein